MTSTPTIQIKCLPEYDVDVNIITHEELMKLASQICSKSVNELNNLVTEAAKSGKAEYLKACWKQDVEERLDFLKDQRKNEIV